MIILIIWIECIIAHVLLRTRFICYVYIWFGFIVVVLLIISQTCMLISEKSRGIFEKMNILLESTIKESSLTSGKHASHLVSSMASCCIRRIDWSLIRKRGSRKYFAIFTLGWAMHHKQRLYLHIVVEMLHITKLWKGFFGVELKLGFYVICVHRTVLFLCEEKS